MSSGGMVGVAGGIFAIQFAPDYEVLGGVPLWAFVLLIVMGVYLFISWRTAAIAARRHHNWVGQPGSSTE